MASAKPTATTRKSTTRKSSGKGTEAEISPARWAGVALVIAALLGAIILAVISPSDPESGAQQGVTPLGVSPAPVASTLGVRVPEAQPHILNPEGGSTTEWDFDVRVQVPQEDLARKWLTLVVMRDGKIIGQTPKPKPGGEVIVVARLLEGTNELSTALEGPDGRGPLSETWAVTLDRDRPPLALTSPKDKSKTFDRTVTVTGTSEPGSEVTVTVDASKFVSEALTAGPAGTFELVVPLKKGPNEIAVVAEDTAGMPRRHAITVQRKDGKPDVTLNAPRSIKRSSLPKTVRLEVEVSDSSGDKMEGALVTYNLGGTRPADEFQTETNGKGRAVWPVEITAEGGSPVLIAVKVESPYGQTRSVEHEIDFN
jgi:bacillopeptidase F